MTTSDRAEQPRCKKCGLTREQVVGPCGGNGEHEFDRAGSRHETDGTNAVREDHDDDRD